MCSDMGLTFLCVRKVFRSKPIEVVSWKDVNYINKETESGPQNAYLVLALGLNRHAVHFLLVSSGIIGPSNATHRPKHPLQHGTIFLRLL